jgi:hypothetical protein
MKYIYIIILTLFASSITFAQEKADKSNSVLKAVYIGDSKKIEHNEIVETNSTKQLVMPEEKLILIKDGNTIVYDKKNEITDDSKIEKSVSKKSTTPSEGKIIFIK